MAAGINEDKMNNFKIELMDYIQKMNLLRNRLDNCKSNLSSNINGYGKQEILNKFDNILNEFSKVNQNLNNYISTIGKVTSVFQEQDSEISSQIFRDISKIERLKED